MTLAYLDPDGGELKVSGPNGTAVRKPLVGTRDTGDAPLFVLSDPDSHSVRFSLFGFQPLRHSFIQDACPSNWPL